jgi:flagellar biosynthetic protein FliR
MNVADLFGDQAGKINLTLVILTAALLAARTLPLIIWSPFLGGEVLPTEIRIGLAATLVLVLFPGVVDRIQHIPLSAVPFILLMMKEVFIGLSIAFIVDMVFDAARTAGHLLDTAAGANMAQVMVPQLQQQTTIFSVLHYQLAIAFFLILNGHHVVIRALAESIQTIPLDTFPPMGAGPWPYFELITRVFADMLKISMALSAPGLIATFLTDLALGMINRVAPQIQVYFISMSIKPVVAALLVFITAERMMDRFHVEFEVMLQRMTEALRLLT